MIYDLLLELWRTIVTENIIPNYIEKGLYWFSFLLFIVIPFVPILLVWGVISIFTKVGRYE
jgi:hypothetical protein